MKLWIGVLAAAVSCNLSAKTLWSDFSVSYLNGSNYEVGDEKRQVVTFEHVTGTTWGDSFLFVDRLESDNGDNETYGEWSPRFKVTSLENSVVTDLYVATTVEMGTFNGKGGFSNSFTNYLVGIGAKISIPHTKFFNVNLYHRNNEQGENNYQATLVWSVPLGDFVYDGFADITNSTDDQEASMNFTSQLKYNLGAKLGFDTPLYVGVEYAYWVNKFGIKDVDEKNASLLVKYHF